MPPAPISAEVTPQPGQATRAARALQRLGFRILHIGITLSVQAPASLWRSVFGVSFTRQKRTDPLTGKPLPALLKARIDALRIPTDLEDLIEAVAFVEPPEFFSTP